MGLNGKPNTGLEVNDRELDKKRNLAAAPARKKNTTKSTNINTSDGQNSGKGLVKISTFRWFLHQHLFNIFVRQRKSHKDLFVQLKSK